MRRTVLFAFAAAIAAAPLAHISPAAAQATLSVTIPGNVAFGYSDGYWDQDHHWHAWRNRTQMEAWHKAHAEHFLARRHAEVANSGWRDERWWEQEHR